MLTNYETIFHQSYDTLDEIDICGFCGVKFSRNKRSLQIQPSEKNHNTIDTEQSYWEGRLQHLQTKHNFRECNSSKKFFKVEHFRQHLKHSHGASFGPWTRNIVDLCRREEKSADEKKQMNKYLAARESFLESWLTLWVQETLKERLAEYLADYQFKKERTIM